MDFRKLRKLIALVQESGIAELEVTQGEEKVRIVRDFPPSTVAAMPTYHAPAVPPIPTSSVPNTVLVPEEDVAEDTLLSGQTICSPMVGTFYRAPSPSAAPFVELGKRVEVGDTLCIIEAMKLLNEIECEYAGVLAQVLVENGQPVEYGQPLFVIQ